MLILVWLVGMHYHLWRIRRRQRNMMLENGILPVHLAPITITTKRNVLDSEMLSTFPTRIIGNQDDSADNNYQQQQHQRRNSTQSERSTRSGKALENATALASASNPSRRASLAATVAARTSGDLSDAMCVICLDEFSAGETVRQLPCGHEYHCECIGMLVYCHFITGRAHDYCYRSLVDSEISLVSFVQA